MRKTGRKLSKVLAVLVFCAGVSMAQADVMLDDFESYPDVANYVIDSAAPVYEGGWISDTWGGGGIATTNVSPLSGTKSAKIFGASKEFTMPIFDGMEVSWLMQVPNGVRGQIQINMNADVGGSANAGIAVMNDGTVKYFVNADPWWVATGFTYTPGNTHYGQPDPQAAYGTYDIYMENPDGTGRQTLTGLANGLLWNDETPHPGLLAVTYFGAALYDDINQVPEPLTLCLLGCGGGMMLIVKRRRR